MPTQKTIKQYTGFFISFMNFVHNTTYDLDHRFPDEVLAEILPDDILRYFKLKAFEVDGEHVLDETVDRSDGRRASTLHSYKKSISYFMPNKIPSWDRINNTGNPTKTVEINDFIKLVQKLECRKKGSPSHTKRALKKREYQFTINHFER
jgi:hypothetical protein